jgi:hypothetical protein
MTAHGWAIATAVARLRARLDESPALVKRGERETVARLLDELERLAAQARRIA